MILFECEDFEVIQHIGGPEILLVTFSSLGMFNAQGSMADGQAYWGKGFVEKTTFSAIGFVAKQKHWFCSRFIEEAAALVAGVARDHGQAIAYGSSMGGYAALRWGRLAGADTAVAFSPQFSIDPAVVGRFDRRYEFAFRPEFHRGMELRPDHFCDTNFVFVDPGQPQDAWHASVIREMASNLHQINLPFCGHACVQIIARSGVAERLLRLCGAADVAAVRRLARETRRSSAIRPVELAGRLLPRKAAMAERIFHKHQNRFAIAQRELFLKKLSGA